MTKIFSETFGGGTRMLSASFLVLCLLINGVWSFYLPGVAPVQFLDGEPVELKVNKLTSVHTQLPYKYYSLPFCQPDIIVDKVENLGEILRGDRIENSMYEIHTGENVNCKVLCAKEYTKEDIEKFAEKVKYEYRVHWIVDNLPAAIPKTYQDANGEPTTVYETGFPLGFKGESVDGKKEVYFINNHVHIKLLYHENADLYVGKRIVGFEVEPESIQHSGSYDENDPKSFPSTCLNRDNVPYEMLDIMPPKTTKKIVWTYSITWEQSDVSWAQRWDKYLLNTDPQIHWFSIINSLMIVLFLTGMVAMIMMRTLHADFRRYNSMDPNEEAE